MAYIYTSPEKANIYIHDFDSSKQVIINDNAYFFSDLLITEYEVDGKMSHIVSVGSEIIIDTSLDDCFFIDGDKSYMKLLKQKLLIQKKFLLIT